MKEYYWDGENYLYVEKTHDTISYYLNRILHRNDGPAKIEYNNDGNISKEEYWINNEIYRENGPSVIYYFKDGSIFNEIYFKNNEIHRENKPARIFYYENGLVFLEENLYNGLFHKIDGPAVIWYYHDNNNLKQYYFNGIEFEPDKLPFELPIDTKEKEFLFNLKYGVNND